IPGSVGFFLVGAIAAFAMLSYLWGSHVVRLRGQLPETMTMRARRLARRRAPAALRARRPAGGPETEPEAPAEARTDGRERTSLPPPAPPGTADRTSPPAPPDLVDLTS